jgi:hypothetical protein
MAKLLGHEICTTAEFQSFIVETVIPLRVAVDTTKIMLTRVLVLSSVATLISLASIAFMFFTK